MFIFDRGLKSYNHTCIDPQTTLSLSFSLESELHHKLQLVFDTIVKKENHCNYCINSKLFFFVEKGGFTLYHTYISL